MPPTGPDVSPDDRPDATAQVIVVGGGPAGRALTHRLGVHGVHATLVDPHPDRQWVATYAAWHDELPSWIAQSALASVVDGALAYTPERTYVDRAYAVFDTPALRQSLDPLGARVVTGTAREVSTHRVRLDGAELVADTVIDCRGGGSHGPRQTAYGIVVERGIGEQILGPAPAVLMDWRHPDPNSRWQADGPPASFLYAIPLGADHVLLEETCLAGAPAIGLAELAERLSRRLSAAGIGTATVAAATSRTERVSFPLAGAGRRPWSTDPICYGARGGLLNPITGYSVGVALREADSVAASIAQGIDPRTVLWPRRARTVWKLRLRSLAVLLDLDPVQTTDFFTGFFSLPQPMQASILSDRADPVGTAAAMTRVFAAIDHRTRLRVLRSMMRSAAHPGE